MFESACRASGCSLQCTLEDLPQPTLLGTQSMRGHGTGHCHCDTVVLPMKWSEVVRNRSSYPLWYESAMKRTHHQPRNRHNHGLGDHRTQADWIAPDSSFIPVRNQIPALMNIPRMHSPTSRKLMWNPKSRSNTVIIFPCSTRCHDSLPICSTRKPKQSQDHQLHFQNHNFPTGINAGPRHASRPEGELGPRNLAHGLGWGWS